MSTSDGGTQGTPEAAADDPLVGQLVAGRYRIQERLAAGGMGVVYRGLQEPLGRAVAVKVLRRPKDPRLDTSYAERFLREAAVVANLNHPNTVVVYDYGNDGPNLYFAMEFLEGQTLTQRVHERGPMAPVDVLRVGRQIASSLGDAHAGGLVHRDLKPGNIMICPRRHDPLFVKVLDFGLVKLISEEQAKKLTQSGIMMGSPRYMSPEQVRGIETIDHRADIYSFGALMTFCLAGRPPFPDGSQFEAMRHHVYTAPPAIRSLNPRCTVSAELEHVVLRCLAKDPGERFQSMTEVLAAFERCPEAKAGPDDDDAASYDDGGRTSVDLLPPGARSGEPPVPAGGSESQISQISSSWFRRADGSSLSAFGWLIRGLIAVTFVLAGAAAAFFVPQVVESAMQVRPPVPSLPPVAPTAPTDAPAEEGTAEAEPEAPSVVMLRSVEIETEPSGATVSREGESLGTTPLAVEVAEGEAWVLSLEREGYRTERLRVDGTRERLTIELTPTGGSVRATRRTTQGSPSMTEMTTTEMDGAGGAARAIRDPWGS